MTEEERWLTVTQAAKYHQKLVRLDKALDVSTVYRWVRSGQVRARRGPGVRTLILSADIERLADLVRPVPNGEERTNV